MALELIYTSAEAGIRPGTHGFCTVAASRELPAPLASTLESLSGYRHLFPPKTPNARFNPVVCSHLTLPFNGKPIHIVSRIADAGLDYTDRTNKIAHHLVLQRGDFVEAGAAALFGMPNLFVEQWHSKPTIFPSAKIIPAMNIEPAVCKTWDRIGGDPGWGGVLAASVLQKRPVSIVAAIGMDLLPLFQEAIALLPENRRWDATFSTYYSKLPPGIEALWKGVLTGSAEEGYVRAIPRALILDLTRPLGDIGRYCSDGVTAALVEAARTGKAAAAGEESASNTEPGLGFSKDAASRGAGGLSFTKKPSVPSDSAVPPIFSLDQEELEGGELPQIEGAAREKNGKTLPRRTAEKGPKRKSPNLYFLALVTAVVFVCLLVVGGGYLQYRRDVETVTGNLEKLRQRIAGEGDEQPGWQEIISDINGIAVPEKLEASTVEEARKQANEALVDVSKFVQRWGENGTNTLPDRVPEKIDITEIRRAKEELEKAQGLTPPLEERKRTIENYLSVFNENKSNIGSSLEAVKEEVRGKKTEFLTDLDRNKEIEQGFLLGTLRIKSAETAVAKEQVDKELKDFQAKAELCIQEKVNAFKTAWENLQDTEKELGLIKETLNLVENASALKTTLDAWPRLWAERSQDKDNLYKILSDTASVRVPMITVRTEPRELVAQIFSAEQWKTLDTICEKHMWQHQVSFESIFPEVNKKYSDSLDEEGDGEGTDTPLVLRLEDEKLFFSVGEGTNNSRDMRDVNDVLFSRMTWTIEDQTGNVVHNEDGEELTQADHQLLEERSISADTIILQKPRKEENSDDNKPNEETKKESSSENTAQETVDERFWKFIQQRLQDEAVYSKCSGLIMCEIEPGGDGDVSHGFGIYAEYPIQGPPDKTRGIILRYNGRPHRIEDIVFLDRSFFDRWLDEFKILERDKADETFFSKIKGNPTLNTSISLVRREGNRNIEIILFQFDPSQSDKDTKSN